MRPPRSSAATERTRQGEHQYRFSSVQLPPPENKFYNFLKTCGVCEWSSQFFYQIVDPDLKEREVYLIHARPSKRGGGVWRSLALLNASFVTPIDREDIQLISTYLYKSTKVVLKACVNLRIYQIDAYNDIVKKQAEIRLGPRRGAGCTTVTMMLKKGSPPGRGDRLLLAHQGHREPRRRDPLLRHRGAVFRQVRRAPRAQAA